MQSNMLLYIDPGTGAMLFTTIIGLVTTASFVLKKYVIKLKFRLTGGKEAVASDEKIPYVIFSDSKRYWNVFGSICDEFEKRKIPVEYWTASPDDPALSQDYEYVKCSFIGEGNRAYAKLNMMNAYICLGTTPGLDVYQWKRSRNTKYYVHTSHEVGGFLWYRMFGIDYFDAILLTGAFQEAEIRELEKIRHLPAKEMPVVGATYMDELAEKVKNCGITPEGTTVLLAPTWGPSSILNRFGVDFLEALKDTGYEIIVRPHPQSKTSEKDLLERLEKEFPESEKWHWNYDNDNFEVLAKSSILISDFSGVVYDYALAFNRSFIYVDTELDKSPYDVCWRETPCWRETSMPLIGRKLEKEEIPQIKEIIDEVISSTDYANARERCRQESWMYEGEAAVRTVNYLTAKLEELRTQEAAEVQIVKETPERV